ncbi:class I SAM-dependent methyltransferase [Streptosporangium sp. NBC_01755]|uniref:class I SAM-dependent methyltransferase n=1 Tax=unclassified Streptosporangium TaxID=2632669 RepID=UPI002DDB360D|nr:MULTISPECIES: class I SAM-dependent methyltransferase [unclassified Streptosporangium]WSA26192.1 class I SAM-dependent methyltransferase [Streptosporangium sp. NBC_01810]WSD02378.1 class I SAM-dependent methyltransferase [Streptosporangium sp. NBC_01755]
MAPHDALTGWNEDTTAEAYAAFTRDFPMYGATSRDLARRAHLAGSRLVVDLCGGAGATAEAILALVPAEARVISLDSAAAMQRVGRGSVTDPRLLWVTARAEDLAEHVSGMADAVVCNSAIWKTDVPAVFAAVRSALRPGGRFVFNIGGGFAGIAHPDEQTVRTSPSLNMLIRQVAAREYGHTPSLATSAGPKLPLEVVTEHLAAAGLTLLDTQVTAQHGTMAEKKAWLSVPVFARPHGDFTHEQRMAILDEAYALTTPETPTVTSWLVAVAERPAEEP